MKNVKHTAKFKEFYSSCPYIHHPDSTINILWHLLYHISIHLSIPLSIHYSSYFLKHLKWIAGIIVFFPEYFSMHIINWLTKVQDLFRICSVFFFKVEFTLATWCKELIHWKRPWCWERLKAGGEGDDRGWDGWMASSTQWTWVWVNSGSWW